MDSTTAAYYQAHATDLAVRYESAESPVARFFASAFPQGSRVLDVGAGSGRDIAALLASGYDACGAEPSQALRQEALRHHPELQNRLAETSLPNLGQPFGGAFDGVLCSAVLMHVSEADLFDAAFSLRDVLKPHGRLLISLPLSRPDVKAGRDPFGRMFSAYTAEHLQLLFERLGFQAIGRWDSNDALGRAGTRWYTLLFELRSGTGVRAVDQIEGILNRDRKEATYKLALFRGPAELATQEPHCVTWRGDGTVGVPVRRLSEKWLDYYWPLFAGEFIPQSKAEAAGSAKQLGFRRAVTELMQPYRDMGAHGGFTAWHLDLSGGTASLRTREDLESALRAIDHAIRYGPVHHASGALQSGRVFEFDPTARQILKSADLWREFSLIGHWIVDAVVLRWAELTERFGHRQGIQIGRVLSLLIARPELTRATSLARGIFVRQQVQHCVWSDRRLAAEDLAVDHVIPFSLWGSNDLWNLMPTHSKVNCQKSDMLPAAPFGGVKSARSPSSPATAATSGALRRWHAPCVD